MNLTLKVYVITLSYNAVLTIEGENLSRVFRLYTYLTDGILKVLSSSQYLIQEFSVHSVIGKEMKVATVFSSETINLSRLLLKFIL